MLYYIFLFLLYFTIESGGQPRETTNHVPINKLETIQFVNNSPQEKPLKIFLFLTSNDEFLQKLKFSTKPQLLEIVKDINCYTYENRFFLLAPPEVIELTRGAISKKLLIHYNRQALMGIGILIVTFDGSYIYFFSIPGDCKNFDNPNLLFIIDENNKIVVKNGIISPWEKRKIASKY